MDYQIKTYEELLKMHGEEVIFDIRGCKNIIGTIYVDTKRKKVFVCQNIFKSNGADAPDKLGYKYSYSIGGYTEGFGVISNIRRIEKLRKIYKEDTNLLLLL